MGVKSHIEKHVLPKCLEAGMRLFGYVSAEYIKDMGTPDRYYAVCDDVKSGKVARLNRCNKRPEIFSNRDGVINKEVNLLNKAEQMELIPGAAEDWIINMSESYIIGDSQRDIEAGHNAHVKEAY